MPDTHITCSEYHQNFTLMSQLCTRVGRKKIWKKGGLQFWETAQKQVLKRISVVATSNHHATTWQRSPKGQHS